MGWNRHAHPNESSVGCVFCVPEVICAEVSAVKSTRCPLCLPKFHAELVQYTHARNVLKLPLQGNVTSR